MKRISSIKNIKKISNKTCLVYVNFDIKIQNGAIEDDRKVREIIDTIEYLSFKNSKIILFSDNSNIREIEIVLEKLKNLLKLNKQFNKEIILYKKADLDNLDNVIKIADFGDIVCIRSLRYYDNYKKYFNKDIDYFIFENFENLYNNSYLSDLSKIKTYYGFSFCEKYDNFLKLKIGKNKNVAIVGGEYNKEKIEFIENLLKAKSTILLGGEVSAMFSYVYINRVLNKKRSTSRANNKLYSLLKKYKKNIVLPIDFIVSRNKHKYLEVRRKSIKDLSLSDYIFDIGPDTIKKYLEYINRSNILIWSGLLGMVEDKKFSNSSLMMAEIFCNKSRGKAFGVVVGNRTCRFVIDNKFGDDVDYLFFEKQTFYNLVKQKLG
ncbi:phosphoglycerate kinase [Patescibacteria group bacterium]|nr:phosphoglycerate kinase [Patescibacteria group bacterium]HOC96136.1 phosphoglycerate kinase [bacterium]